MLDFEYANKEFLWLLLILVPLIAWYILKINKHESSLTISSTSSFRTSKISFRTYLRHILFLFRVAALALLIVAMARPQSTETLPKTNVFGIDIAMALDVSTSMLAMDLKPDRLEAAKSVASTFITGRIYDRVGLVIFAGESFTQCPVTKDHKVVLNLLKDIKSGLLEDGTAIGMGLANCIARLKDSDAKSKVIILLTDGENNRGEIDPLTAAEMAQSFGIKVYTIGVGTIGEAPYPFETPFGTQVQNVPVKIDEDLLKEIARLTGGRYYRATNTDKLKEIYSEIDTLEKTKIEDYNYSKKNEEFLFFALIALALLAAELLLKYTLFKNIP
ncbi:MAG: VWA domain-containing protein [Bacteroidales bacterium]|nr:VWA domain-containing protein [Bacteroidales bacterium]